ncbi:MAG: DUF5686 family protein, partial [Chitinophagaceae bacterium]
GGEDPAYEIIRNAIRKRKDYLNQFDRFQCEVYIKGQLKLRKFPKKFLGQTVDFDDGDTSKLKMLYLAESVATYSVQKPDKVKIEVTSTKVSGQSDGFGLSQPQILNFYENIVSIGRNLNPRGFVSPIAANALEYYHYKLEGVFIEDGKEVNKISVVARRKFQPAFSGTINIIENDWRIHSLDLQLTKESQMEFIDTLRISQIYVPLQKDIWVIKSQVIYPSIKFFGFDGYGSFVNLYSDFNVAPVFAKNFFGNTYLKYQDSSNKRSSEFWDSLRPVPLLAEETRDYRLKDSVAEVRRSPAYLDSIDRIRNKFNVSALLFTGQSFSRQKKKMSYSISPLIRDINYNTVEGLVINHHSSFRVIIDSVGSRRHTLEFDPHLRYGFSNQHVNGSLRTSYNFGSRYFGSLSLTGGKEVFQYNNQSNFTEWNNSFTTIVFEKNFMKIYEAWFGRMDFAKGMGDGFTVRAGIEFQDRMSLDNTSVYPFRDVKGREFTANYPVDLITKPMDRHQALVANAGISWQPGAKYIEFPDRKINIGSKYPLLTLSYTKGINGLLGSDVKYDKWRFQVTDDINFKLAGLLSYRVALGGFINNDHVEVPDYQHFNGNQSLFAGSYLNTFQLATFYKYSTATELYTTINLEYHFNGLLSNRVPGLRKLKWNLVAGTNAFYVNSNKNYFETFVGLENIFKVIRIDFVQSFSAGEKPYSGIVIGLSGSLFGRRIR